MHTSTVEAHVLEAYPVLEEAEEFIKLESIDKLWDDVNGGWLDPKLVLDETAGVLRSETPGECFEQHGEETAHSPVVRR
eukprot:1949316-Amphidinium_carterae.1